MLLSFLLYTSWPCSATVRSTWRDSVSETIMRPCLLTNSHGYGIKTRQFLLEARL